jgi:hypothetical protein
MLRRRALPAFDHWLILLHWQRRRLVLAGRRSVDGAAGLTTCPMRATMPPFPTTRTSGMPTASLNDYLSVSVSFVRLWC